MVDALEIVSITRDLEKRDSLRNRSYDEVLRHYGGTTYEDRKHSGTCGSIRKGLSQFFSLNATRHEDEDVEVRNPINLTRPTVLAKVAFMGLPPSIRVPEPSSLEPEAASDFADNLEKCILGHWAFSNMPRRCYDMAWYQGAFGGAVMGVWPDMRHKRPRIFTRSPQDFFPVTYDEDGMELQLCIFVERRMDGRSAAARFDRPKLVDKDEVEVIQYIDGNQMSIVVDGSMAESVKNPLGVVPVVCIGNIGIPGTPFGDTDVGAAMSIENEINYRVALADEQAGKTLNPTVAAIGDSVDMPDDFELGQGGRIKITGTGRVDLLAPGDIPHTYWDGIQLLQNWYDQVSDNPAQLRGEGFGSILTGKGFNASLGPTAARLQIRRNLVDPPISQVNRYLLTMWDKFPKFNRKLKLTGTIDKEFFQVEFSPDDFKLEGPDGKKHLYTENEVFLSSNAFVDRQGEVVELLQLYQNEAISWDTLMEYNPYVHNKARERVRIQKDREWKASGMAIAAQAAQSPATANPDLGAQERTAYGLERGFMGEMPTPPGAEAQMPGAAPAAQGPEMEGEAPEVIDVIVEALAEIPRLKGQVWVGGDVLLNPESVTADGDWTVTIWLEDPVDKATISNYLRKNLPELYGRVEYRAGEPSGEEPAIPVGETEEEPSFANPEQVPEQMMAANQMPEELELSGM